MKNKIQLLAEKLRSSYHLIDNEMQSPGRCLIGFDGFTDEIATAVLTRRDVQHYEPMTEIAQLGQRILSAVDKSCNIEWIVRKTKIGGNAPILTNALLEGRHRIVFMGTIGRPGQIEPLFSEMAERCEEVYPLGPSGLSRALEFRDGKVIFGSLASVLEVDASRIFDSIAKEAFVEMLQELDLFVSANWTMLPGMTDFWEQLVRDVIPRLVQRRRFFFVDLADPAKRSDKDLERALSALKRFKQKFEVILGLNHAEALRVGDLYAVKGNREETIDAVSRWAASLYDAAGLSQIVIHTTKYAVTASKEGVVSVEGPYCPEPLLTTGAGDNFNAGYCNALLYGYSIEESLLNGVFTSGFYVRHGRSPTILELADFLVHR